MIPIYSTTVLCDKCIGFTDLNTFMIELTHKCWDNGGPTVLMGQCMCHNVHYISGGLLYPFAASFIIPVSSVYYVTVYSISLFMSFCSIMSEYWLYDSSYFTMFSTNYVFYYCQEAN